MKTGRPSRSTSVLRLALGAAAAAAVLVGAFGMAPLLQPDAPSGPVDMAGNRVAPEETPTGETHATPSGIGDFAVPSVGLEVPLGAMDLVNNTINPPGFTSAYWIRNLGVPPAQANEGTVFVAMHSLRDGGIGPGNYLIDVNQRRPAVEPGTLIQVAGTNYHVTTSRDVAKTELGSDSTLWENIPGRLVIITCLQRPEGGVSTRNVVLEATIDSPAAAQPTAAPAG